MRYRRLSTGTLRAMLATLTTLGVLSRQRESIQTELAIREWAAAIECRLGEWGCAWTSRGGVS